MNIKIELIKRLPNYKKFKRGFISEEKFYNWLIQKAGQSILDQISNATNTRPKIFNLTNEEVVLKTKELLNKYWNTENRIRAIFEYIRYITAKYNGFSVAIRKLEDISDKCVVTGNEYYLQNNIKNLPPFESGCKCRLFYDIDEVDMGLHRLVYENTKPTEKMFINEIYVNPNNLWIGWENFIGKDKLVNEYVINKETIKERLVIENGIFKIDKIINALIKCFDKEQLEKEVISKFAREPNFYNLIKARINLTDVWFLQLITKYWYGGYVNTLNKRKMPNYKIISNVVKEKAQETVLKLSKNNLINLRKLWLPVCYKNIKTEEIEYSRDIISINKILFSKNILEVRRVLSIMENFNECQKRCWNWIDVIYNKESNQYFINNDGNHRLFASYMLWLQKINVKVKK